MSLVDDSELRRVEQAKLGLAIGHRANEIYVRTIEVLYRKGQPTSPSETYLDYRWGRSVIGTLLIARWLVSGIGADHDELEWITRSGGAAAREGVPLVETTRGHFHWRDILIDVAHDEAAKLGTPPQIVAQVEQVIRANADASLVRIANSYDLQLREINGQLSQASAFKTEFLAKMSHQLRTPLTAIIGFCELLMQGMDGALTGEQAEDIAEIHHSGQVLLALVNDILDLTKIEAGKIEVSIQAINLEEIVGQVVSSLSQMAAKKGLVLSCDLSPDVPTVMADPGRLREIVTNLVSNAIKFTNAGSVTIESRRVDSMAELAVVDTGIGIEPSAHGRIFEEFRQASDQISNTYGGSGLGLPIARRLVELQGGSMGLESRPGTGSRFWFTLPVGAPASAA